MADSAFMALFRKKESEKSIGWTRTHSIVCVRCANRLSHSSSVLSPFNFLAARLLKQSVAYLVCHVYGCM